MKVKEAAGAERSRAVSRVADDHRSASSRYLALLHSLLYFYPATLPSEWGFRVRHLESKRRCSFTCLQAYYLRCLFSLLLIMVTGLLLYLILMFCSNLGWIHATCDAIRSVAHFASLQRVIPSLAGSGRQFDNAKLQKENSHLAIPGPIPIGDLFRVCQTRTVWLAITSPDPDTNLSPSVTLWWLYCILTSCTPAYFTGQTSNMMPLSVKDRQLFGTQTVTGKVPLFSEIIPIKTGQQLN